MVHPVFWGEQVGQRLTIVLTPIWMWADDTRMTGAWCLLVTTYVDDMDTPDMQNIKTHTGLVLVSTLKRQHVI